MIVVTAVHNGSGRIRSASSGTTIVSPGCTEPESLNHRLPPLSTLPFARTT